MAAKDLITRICTACKLSKCLSEFHKCSNNKSGLYSWCKQCALEKNNTYIKTKAGLLAKIYGDQRNSSRKRGYDYPDYSLSELRVWALSKKIFNKLYSSWVKSGYQKDMRPSFDRLDDYKSYTFDNLQIVTWKENNEKAYADRKNGINNKHSKAVTQTDFDGNFIAEYFSSRCAARSSGINRGHIWSCCVGDRKTAGGFKWAFA